MNKPTVFTGAAPAIITPLTPAGIDFDRYGAMIDWQIEAGIDAIVAVGTTGEGSTLSDEEHRAPIKYCVERGNHRVPASRAQAPMTPLTRWISPATPPRWARMPCCW